jgi:hypothetical protein
VPSLAAYLWTRQTSGPEQAAAVAFASVITTQLAQTLDVGRVEGFLSPTVIGAVGGSLAMLAGVYSVPPVRNLFGLIAPSLASWGTIAVASAGAVALSRAVALTEGLVARRREDERPGVPRLMVAPAVP